MSHGKRHCIWLGLLCVMILPAVSEAVVVSLNPPHAAFGADNQQTVHVMVDQVDSLLSAAVTLAFDPAVVTVVEVSPGYLVTDAGCPATFGWQLSGEEPGAVVMNVAMEGCQATGSGVLFAVTFLGVAAGTSPLDLLEVTLHGAADQPLPVEVQGGDITYAPVVTAYLSFDTSESEFDSDGSAEFCLDLAGAEDFQRASLIFGFDPAVISLVSVEAGAALEGLGCEPQVQWVNEDDWVDTMAIDVVLADCSGPVSGPLVCITVAGVAPGESPLYWLEAAFYDGANARFPVIVEDGSLPFQQVIATEAASFSQVKALFR